MADKKNSAYPTNTSPALTDLLLSLDGVPSNQNIPVSALKALIQKNIQLDTGGGYSYSAGQMSFDAESGTAVVDTAFSGVRVNVGQELHIRFKNESGGAIANGTVINASGVDTVNDVIIGSVADITSPATSSAIIGVATAEVLDGEIGIATSYGEVRGVDTDGLATGGVLYAGVGGGFTQTLPQYPNRVVILGSVIKSGLTDGIVQLDTQVFDRGTGSKSYSFTQANVGSGIYYSGGFYDFATVDANLSQAISTISFGSANTAYSAHASAIFGGAGVVDSGQVGLRVNGSSIDDDGVLTVTDSQDITDDITSVALNDYLETPKKWVGTVEYELYVVSGTPAAYSLDFNYGYAKYEDLGNLKFTVTGLEVVGTAGANDTGFEMELLYHKDTGWTYAATGFTPGNGTIATWSGDMAPYDNLVNGENFAWKRTNLNQYVDGAGSEGVLFRITAGQNNSVQSSDIHLSGVVEQLVF